jgi:hypothetical protein
MNRKEMKRRRKGNKGLFELLFYWNFHAPFSERSFFSSTVMILDMYICQAVSVWYPIT